MEKRASLRNRVLKAGSIEFDGGAINCVVRNLSSTGARLDVATPAGIPERFTLILPADGYHTYCTVVWRKEKQIGVTFG